MAVGQLLFNSMLFVVLLVVCLVGANAQIDMAANEAISEGNNNSSSAAPFPGEGKFGSEEADNGPEMAENGKEGDQESAGGISLFKRMNAAAASGNDDEEGEGGERPSAAGTGKEVNGNGPSAELVADKKEEEKGDKSSAEDRPPIVGFDYDTGNELTQEEADKLLYYVEAAAAGRFKANCWVTEEGKPLQLRFLIDVFAKSNAVAECSVDGKNKRIFRLKICLKEEERECPNGFIICFPGLLDPANTPDVLDIFALKNVPENAIAKICQEHWNKLGLPVSGVHGLRIKSKKVHTESTETQEESDDIQLEMEASYSNKTEMLELDSGNCANVLLMGDEKRVYGSFEGEDESLMKDFENKILNGGYLVDGEIRQNVALDLLSMFRQNFSAKLTMHGTGDCKMHVQIYGDNLSKCRNRACSRIFPIPEQTKLMDKKKLYAKDFHGMKVVTRAYSQAELPEALKYRLYFQEDKDGRPLFVIATDGEEFPFAVATKEGNPPKFMILRPANDKYCVKRGQDGCIRNELVLAFNARPDCFYRFCWSERKLMGRDDLNYFNDVLSIRDQLIEVVGENFDEFSTMDQFGAATPMGRGTCTVEYEHALVPIEGAEKNPFIYRFVVNPTRSEMTPKAMKADCKWLAIGFYWDEAKLLLPAHIHALLPQGPPVQPAGPPAGPPGDKIKPNKQQ